MLLSCKDLSALCGDFCRTNSFPLGPPGDSPANPTPWVHLSPPPHLGQPWGRDGGGLEGKGETGKGHSPLWLPHQLGAGIIRNPAAFSIGPFAGPCNLDWGTQFSGFTSVLVTFPKWVMHIVKAGLKGQ